MSAVLKADGEGMQGRVAAEEAHRNMQRAVREVRSSASEPPAPVPWAARVAETARTSGQLLRLDPMQIRPSRFANRLEFNWGTRAFKDLKKAIASTDGNVQPVLVRPVADGREITYELVYGHRRHRACVDLNLKVLAVVEALDDGNLFKRMVHENRKHLDCSPYERGLHFKKARDAALFPSDRRMAEELGIDHSTVSKVIKLAQLPELVIQAFRTPADIRVSWGATLHNALAKDREGMLGRAAAISQAGARRPAKKEVYAQLLAAPLAPALHAAPKQLVIAHLGQHKATIVVPPAAHGQGITVTFMPGAVEAESLRATLQKLVAGSAS